MKTNLCGSDYNRPGFQVPWVILRQNAGADAICYGRDGKESLLRIDPAEFSCLSYF